MQKFPNRLHLVRIAGFHPVIAHRRQKILEIRSFTRKKVLLGLNCTVKLTSFRFFMGVKNYESGATFSQVDCKLYKSVRTSSPPVNLA